METRKGKMTEDIKLEKGNGGDEKPAPLVMTITMNPEGSMSVGFSMLENQIFAYGFLKMAEKTLDDFYKVQTASRIEKPHGILNFARGKH